MKKRKVRRGNNHFPFSFFVKHEQMFINSLTRTIVRDILNTERGVCMKEIVKSKVMMGFIVFVLGFTYIDSLNVKKMEQENLKLSNDFIVMNEK